MTWQEPAASALIAPVAGFAAQTEGVPDRYVICAEDGGGDGATIWGRTALRLPPTSSCGLRYPRQVIMSTFGWGGSVTVSVTRAFWVWPLTSLTDTFTV